MVELLALATLLTALGNAMAFPVIPGSYFSLAMTPSLIASGLFGPLAGIAVNLGARLIVPPLFGTLYGEAIYLLEIVVIGALKRKKPRLSILILDGLFWPLLGLPLRAASYYFILGLSPESLLLTLLRAWLLGLFNAYLSELVSIAPALSRFLGRQAVAWDIGEFIKARINLLFIPLALIGILGAIDAFSANEERELELRLGMGLDRFKGRLERAGPLDDNGSIVKALNAYPVDPEGRFLVTADRVVPGAIPWDGKILSFERGETLHPLDDWRRLNYYASIDLGEAHVHYILAFETFFLKIASFYSAALASCIGLLYGVYILISHAGSTVRKRSLALIVAAHSLPERIERGEDPLWPVFDIAELASLSEEFREVSLKLKALFAEIGDSRDRLELAVLQRTRELEGRTREVQLLLAKVEDEREEERSRLARELHDGLGQELTGLGMALFLLERRIGARGETVAETIADMRKCIEDLSGDMRNMVTALRPGVLDRLGLVEALTALARELRGRCEIGVEFHSLLPKGVKLPEEAKIAAYRIAQEGLSNALRHSGASCVSLELGIERGSFVLRVEDDGKGFDPQRSGGAGSGSFGLLGMRERCQILGGRFDIESTLGGGTVLIARIPLGPGSADAHTHR